jgi:hypothetical protein
VTGQDEETHALPRLESVFAVFSQESVARVDIAGWDAHATRFFATRLERADDPAPTPLAPPLAVLVSPDGQEAGVRRVFARPRVQEDLTLAEAADEAGAGLALLARRCPTVWLVVRESDADPLALHLAAILASVLLGPILDARVPELLGVKSARARLEW